MSMGRNAIRAIIDAGSVTAFRKLKKEWFLEEELELYEFVKAHFRRYSSIPDIKVLRENGFELKQVQQPVKYYIDRLSSRAVYNAVNKNHKSLTDAMRERDIPSIKNAIRKISQAAKAVDNNAGYSTLNEQALAIGENYREAKARSGLQGITSGYAVLDSVTNGFQPGDLVVLAGRPNIGKSYTLMHMMKAAWKDGHPCAGVSMEMTSNQLSTRFIGMHTGLNPDLIRKGQLSSRYGERILFQAIRDVQDRPQITFLEGNFRKSVGDVDNLVQEFSPDALYIDAGYLLTPEKTLKSFSKRDYISATMEELKILAQDRHIPVIVSVQFNRQMKLKSKQEMDVSFLAETDVIGQIATLVIGIRHGKAPYEEVTRELGLIKNREGSLITFQTDFCFNPMNFEYRDRSELLENEELDEDGQSALEENSEIMENSGWSR